MGNHLASWEKIAQKREALLLSDHQRIIRENAKAATTRWGKEKGRKNPFTISWDDDS